jgi:multidrug resistance efflux pump
MTKYLLLIAGVGLIAGLGVVIDAQSRMPVHRPPRAEAASSIYATGRIEGATPEIELRPQLAGRVVRVPVAEGQRVARGEALVELDDAEYRQQVELAAADVELAEAELERLLNGAHPQERSEAAALYRAKLAEYERADETCRRLQELYDQRVISQEEARNQQARTDALKAEVEAAKAHLDRIEAGARPEDVRMARARVQAAKAGLELARVHMERMRLTAPASGQILQVHVEAGELAGPTSSEPALVMADTSRLRVRAFVEELDAPRVEVGMAATVTADGLRGRRFAGRVVRLSPLMGAKEIWSDRPGERYDTKTREVWIELEQAASLVLGLRVDVTIDPHTGPGKDDAGDRQPAARLP